MTAEQRAALRWAILLLGGHFFGATVEAHLAALQALLDEKGGDAREPGRSGGARDLPHQPGLPVAGAASTAPPDSPAKIAADLRELVVNPKTSCQAELAIISARVEALGREPSEREVVRQVLQGLLDYRNGTAQMIYVDTAIAALAPIAEKERANAQFASDTLDRVVREHAALRAAVEKIRDELLETINVRPGAVMACHLREAADALDAALRGGA